MSDAFDRELLIRIDERMAQALAQLVDIQARLTGHSSRIRKLEVHRSWLAGAIAALGAAFGAAMRFLIQ